jgi:N-methylhydantoinase A/oxoprolinase/acetone carboxylase beta subunit
MSDVIGVDVGGTNTDAVRLRGGRIAASCKVPTTPEVGGGIVAALERVRDPGSPLGRVHIGTTSFTNALVTRRGLASAAAVRIGAPVSESLPPTIDWPTDLQAAVHIASYFVRGGREYDGRPIRPLDRAEIARAGQAIARAGIGQVALTSVFGTSFPEDELQVAEWLAAAHPELSISLSHRIGRFGILERENGTLLNAMLRPLAVRTIASYRRSVPDSLFISQNDGTTMRAEEAESLPVFTIASGPTNSLRGAALLTGAGDAIVCDVGGTTTDVGLLRDGYPQLAGLDLEIAGLRTNFRMPDLVSVGVGGGSLVDEGTGAVGPESVGHRLVEEARVFGGTKLTLTDVAVAAGRVEIGDAERVRGISRELVLRVEAHLRARLGRLLEAFERAGQRLPVVLVGGGAPLVQALFAQLGREVVHPEYAAVANAYGAAIAQVGGEADLTFSSGVVSRREAMARAEREAHRRALEAGARADSIHTVELEDAAFSYLASSALRVRAKAVGELEVAP